MGSYPKGREPRCPTCETGVIRSRHGRRCRDCAEGSRATVSPPAASPTPAPPSVVAPTPSAVSPETLGDLLLVMLRQPHALEDLATRCRVTAGQALDGLVALRTRGHNIHELGGKWSLEREPVLGSAGLTGPYVSRPNGRYRFGWLGDTHLCSKYQRLDVLLDLYRRFADADIDRIFHAGNWIDGEARFNKFDLLVHGMDPQIQYLVDRYPVAPNGLVTYAIAGDDHEGWYGQREGVDIGRYAEHAMRAAGRADWVNLGYMEAFVPLQHAQSGQSAQLHLVHPGGGSAYAVSYTVQKLVESYSGGNKPAVLIAGHYHKLEYLCTRNVHCIQSGCTQDQTPFARKKRLQYALGGGVCELEQDAATGAIVGCTVTIWNYFDAGFYVNDRFSHARDVNLPPLTRGGAGAVV